MARYYIICNDVEAAWRRVCLNFPAQNTITKPCLNFIDIQFIFAPSVCLTNQTLDPSHFYRCYNSYASSYSEENMDMMIDWIRDTIKGIYEKEKKDIMKILGQTMTKLTPPTIVTWILPVIKKVIFNNPATIVMWEDGTKTVVKAEGEDYDPEKGLAMAIAKKAFGNEGNYYNEFKKWLPKEN